MNEIYNIDQVAKYLNLSSTTVYKLCQEGKIPHSRLGKQFRFKKSAIDKMVFNDE